MSSTMIIAIFVFPFLVGGLISQYTNVSSGSYKPRFVQILYEVGALAFISLLIGLIGEAIIGSGLSPWILIGLLVVFIVSGLIHLLLKLR